MASGWRMRRDGRPSLLWFLQSVGRSNRGISGEREEQHNQQLPSIAFVNGKSSEDHLQGSNSVKGLILHDPICRLREKRLGRRHRLHALKSSIDLETHTEVTFDL